MYPNLAGSCCDSQEPSDSKGQVAERENTSARYFVDGALASGHS